MKRLSVLFLFFLLAACIDQKGTPDGILSKQKMVDFLIDLHIIEARLNTVRFPQDSVKLFFPDIEKELFEKHNITDSIYFVSYQYYLENVKEMEEIYTAVVDSLSIRERILNAD